MSDRYIVIDVETTGLSPQRGGRVIEIGAVAVDGGKIVDDYHSLIDSGKRITLQAQQVHGITNEMLAGQPKPDQVFPEFHRFIGDGSLVAHNASFDMTFLRYEFGRLGLGFSNSYHCTLAMCRRLFPGLRDHKLQTVYCHLFGAPPEGARPHRALDDARMTARVWMEMRKL